MSSKKENSLNDSFLTLLRAICRGNFTVLTGINLLMLMGYYLVFVTGTAYVQQTFGVSLSTAGFSSGLLVIGCLAGRFISGNQISRFGGRACLLAGILLYSFGHVIALSRVTRSRYAQATTTFFMAFDLGIGIGPFLFAMLIPIAGYGGMFSALGVLELCALVLCWGIYRHAGKNKHDRAH